MSKLELMTLAKKRRDVLAALKSLEGRPLTPERAALRRSLTSTELRLAEEINRAQFESARVVTRLVS